MYKHVIIDATECNRSLLLWDSSQAFRIAAVSHVAAVSEIIDACWHRFENGAYTGMLLLAESHFSIHTWPETASANLDLFTCSQQDCEPAALAIVAALHAQRYSVRVVSRV
jgi:S-adenosylmethionine decarboxylase proenzyme